VHPRNIPITSLKIEVVFLLLKVVSELKFGHFSFSWPHLTSVTSEVGWKTSNFIVDFDVGKNKDFGVFLSESINFEYLRQ